MTEDKPALTRLDHATQAAIHYLESPICDDDPFATIPTIGDIEYTAARFAGHALGMPSLQWSGVDELELLDRLLAHYGYPTPVRE